ncbi:MAG TPA: hypothetical protein VKB78_02665, partial [Pirellulales bacterium]|nr:hypothetical protein [Pirellulales bacterium]
MSLAGVTYPRPGVSLYNGVEVADPETSAPLARMRFLEVAENSSATAIVPSQPVIDAAQLGRIWQAVSERLRQAESGQPPIRLAAREATLEWSNGSAGGGDSQTITDVLVELLVKSENGRESTATVNFRLAGGEAAEPVRLRYSRRAEQDQKTAKSPNNVITRLELDTGGASIPLSMLAIPFGIVNRLGSGAKFRGSLWASDSGDGWNGELTGVFTDIDLQTAITEQFPHHLDGTATLTIARGRFYRGRLEEARGSFAAREGVIGQSLLSAAARHLQLAGTAGGASNDALVRFDQMAFSFEVDSSGLVIHGQCDGLPGTIVR